MKERHRREESISSAMVVWNAEILPHWDVMYVPVAALPRHMGNRVFICACVCLHACRKGTRRVRELWWQGLPPSVRGRVWSLAIGNELNITAGKRALPPGGSRRTRRPLMGDGGAGGGQPTERLVCGRSRWVERVRGQWPSGTRS